jgi:hypothetical protein
MLLTYFGIKFPTHELLVTHSSHTATFKSEFPQNGVDKELPAGLSIFSSRTESERSMLELNMYQFYLWKADAFNRKRRKSSVH